MDEQSAPATEPLPPGMDPSAMYLAPFIEALKIPGAIACVMRADIPGFTQASIDGNYFAEQLAGLVRSVEVLQTQLQALAKANQHAAKELAHYTRKRPSKLARVLRKNGRGH